MKKTFRIDKNYIYLKSSNDISIIKYGNVVDRLFGGTTYMLYKPAIRDKLVGDYLTVESDDANLQIIVSDERYSTLDMGGSGSSSGGGGEASAEVKGIATDLKTVSADLKVVDTTTQAIHTHVEGIKTDTTASLANDAQVITNTQNIDTGIDQLIADFATFYDYYLKNGGGSSSGGIATISLEENNTKLASILAGINQIQKILICTPRKMDMVVKEATASGASIDAFETLLHDDVNLYYSNTPVAIGFEGGCDNLRIRFLGGIPQKGNYVVSIGYKLNEQPYEHRDLVAKVEMDELVVALGSKATSIEWISVKGVE